MVSAIRTYGIPIVVTALMLAPLAFWSWRVWRDIDGLARKGERFRAADVSKMLTGALQALVADEDLQREAIEAILSSIIRNSPYQCLRPTILLPLPGASCSPLPIQTRQSVSPAS